jgi:hypothetical protein
MSVRNLEIGKSQVIPVLESAIFDAAPDSRFAIGMLAIGAKPLAGRQDEYRSYFDLRRNVYVDETGQLSEADIQADGTDRDEDDTRSVAFGAYENMGQGLARTVGSLRLIMKGYTDEAGEAKPLPIEEFCPEIFEDQPAPATATEVSRFIARHENARYQGLIKWNVYSAGLAYIANNNLGPTYAVIEPWLERELKSTIPVSRIGEPRYVPHYLADNLPIEVHTPQFIKQVEESHPGTLAALRENQEAWSFFGHAAMRKGSEVPAIA